MISDNASQWIHKDILRAIAGGWHPENWDAVTLAYFKTTEGQYTLRILQKVPEMVEAICMYVAAYREGGVVQCSSPPDYDRAHEMMKLIVAELEGGGK